jgi:hypothetical protein
VAAVTAEEVGYGRDLVRLCGIGRGAAEGMGGPAGFRYG